MGIVHLNFKEIFHNDEDADLFIVSIARASNDLVMINNKMLVSVESDINYRLYCIRISVVHLREGIKLLQYGLINKFFELDSRTDIETRKIFSDDWKDTFFYKVIKKSRDEITHYVTQDGKKKLIFSDLIKKKFREMKDENHLSTISYGDDYKKKDTTYDFADELVMSIIFSEGEKLYVNSNDKEIMSKTMSELSELTVKTIHIMGLILNDFFGKLEIVEK